jgi:hypothetical protein
MSHIPSWTALSRSLIDRICSRPCPHQARRVLEDPDLVRMLHSIVPTLLHRLPNPLRILLPIVLVEITRLDIRR